MLKNRPAAFLCLVFSAGTAAGLFFTVRLALIVILVFFCLAFEFYKCLRKRVAVIIVLTALFLAIGYGYSKVFALLSTPDVPDGDAEYSFVGAVRELSVKSSYTYMEAEVQDSSLPFDGELFAMYLYGEAPETGDLIRLSVKLRAGDSYHRSRGVSYIATGSYERLEGKAAEGFYFKVLSLRKSVGALIERAFGKETGSFYKALLTGDRSGLSTKLEAAFSRSGLSHILAISGQHFSIIIYSVYLLLMRLLKRKKLCNVITILLAIAYAVFAGATPSIIRAAFMCCAVFAAELINDRSDPIINLSVVLAVLLLFNPYAILSVSLQLSFLASLGILFTLRNINNFYAARKLPKPLRLLVDPAIMSVAATLFCTPVMLSRFDYVSLVAPVSNIAVNLLVNLAMVGGIVLLPLAFLIKPVAVIADLIYKAIYAVSAFMADLRFACISVYVPYIRLLFVPSFIAVMAFAAYRPKRGVLLISSCALSVILISVGCLVLQKQEYKNNACFYVDDGTTSCFSFYADENMTVLVDGGGKLGVAEAVLERGHSYLDVYIVTACTESTVPRLSDTLPYTPVHTVFVPHEENEYTEEVVNVALEYGCSVLRYKGNSLKIGALEVQTADSEYGAGSYMIKATKHGKTVGVLGSVRYLYDLDFAHCDALVLSNACVDSGILHQIVDYSYEKVYIYHSGYDLYKDLIAENGGQAIAYTGDALFRFGRLGVIKE